jgi:hypothetical protein
MKADSAVTYYDVEYHGTGGHQMNCSCSMLASISILNRKWTVFYLRLMRPPLTQAVFCLRLMRPPLTQADHVPIFRRKNLLCISDVSLK